MCVIALPPTNMEAPGRLCKWDQVLVWGRVAIQNVEDSCAFLPGETFEALERAARRERFKKPEDSWSRPGKQVRDVACFF